MGLLRFLLAFSIVFTHSQPLFGISLVKSGDVAVESFFIISGFYMALVLNEKYIGPGSYKVFITNRLIRLMPAYWAVLLWMIILSVIFMIFFKMGIVVLYENLISIKGLKPLVYFLFTNIAIIGSDTLSFLKLSETGTSLVFATDFSRTFKPFPPVFFFLLIPQIWSVALELYFYLVAPLLVRLRTFVIVALIALSLSLRMFIYEMNLTSDQWDYRFFPTELAFFLAGIISYKIYSRLKNKTHSEAAYLLIFLTVIALTVFYQFIPGADFKGFDLRRWGYYAVMICFVPAIFIYTSKSSIDKYLGELAYPIYISHIAVLLTTTYYFGGNYKEYLFYISIPLIIGTAALMLRFIINPLNGFRQARIRKNLLPHFRESGSDAVNQVLKHLS